jgi:hypothetical protein
MEIRNFLKTKFKKLSIQIIGKPHNITKLILFAEIARFVHKKLTGLLFYRKKCFTFNVVPIQILEKKSFFF